MDELINIPQIDMISREGADWMENIFPSFTFSGFADELISGKSVFQADKILNTIIKLFAGEIYSSVKVLSVIMAVVLLGALSENLRDAFGKRGFNASGIACVSIITGLGVKMFADSCGYAKNVTNDMNLIMVAVLPILITLMAGGGYTLTGSVTHPIVLFMCNVFATIIEKLLIPLSVTYLAISLLDTLSDSLKLTGMRDLVKKTYNFIVGIVMTLFTGLLSITSFASVTLDGLGAKGARFAVSSMVPFVGSSISDAMSAVASSSIVLKNALGTAGIAAIAILCVTPIIKIGAVVFLLRVGAAVCEPIADKKTIQALTSIGDSLSMINAAVISVAVMMVIALSVIVGVK
jgi:stage III sporulation protein AE